MKWTTEMPTNKGFYFLDYQGDVNVVRVDNCSTWSYQGLGAFEGDHFTPMTPENFEGAKWSDEAVRVPD